MNGPIARVLGSLVALAVLAWGLVLSPPTETDAQPASGAIAGLAASGLTAGATSGPGGGVDSPAGRARGLADEAERLYRANDYDKALAVLLDLHGLAPTNVIYVERLAKTYGHLGRNREEAEMWEQFMTLSPTPKEACPQIGRAYETLGQPQQALAAYERCYQVEPTDDDLVYFAARANERWGDHTRAKVLYAEGAKRSPGYSDLAVGLARLQLRDGEVADAARTAVGAARSAPDNVDALLMAGLTLLRQGRPAEARPFLAHGLELKETYADMHFAMGLVEERDGQLKAALAQCTRAVELDPANREAAACRDRVAGKAR